MKKQSAEMNCSSSLCNIHMHAEYKTLTPPCSGMKRLFTSWFLVFRHVEIIFTMLTVPTSPTPPAGLAQSWISTLFEITKFSGHRFLAWRYSHPSHISIWGFIMKFVIVISSAHEHELYSVCVWAPALSRIVQSPTKPNDKINEKLLV